MGGALFTLLWLPLGLASIVAVAAGAPEIAEALAKLSSVALAVSALIGTLLVGVRWRAARRGRSVDADHRHL